MPAAKVPRTFLLFQTREALFDGFGLNQDDALQVNRARHFFACCARGDCEDHIVLDVLFAEAHNLPRFIAFRTRDDGRGNDLVLLATCQKCRGRGFWIEGARAICADVNQDVVAAHFRFAEGELERARRGATIIEAVNFVLVNRRGLAINAVARNDNGNILHALFNHVRSNKEHILRMMKMVDNPHNGVTFCTGSYGTNLNNNLVEMIHALKGRIHFAHIRNLQFNDGMNDFEESAHLSSDGTFDMHAIMKALYDTGFDGIIRPDHGRMIWGEKAMPGYGLYDRALGAAYLCGLWESIVKENQK